MAQGNAPAGILVDIREQLPTIKFPCHQSVPKAGQFSISGGEVGPAFHEFKVAKEDVVSFRWLYKEVCHAASLPLASQGKGPRQREMAGLRVAIPSGPEAYEMCFCSSS